MRTITIFAVLSFWAGLSANAAEPDASNIMDSCYYKNAGNDQRSHMAITIKGAGGKPNTSTYLRLWKNYYGEEGRVDKVLLFTQSPPHKKGLAFMRWGYSAETGKNPEMWIYMPDMQSLRRLSPRDPADKEWVIKDEDLRVREPGEDIVSFQGTQKHKGADYHLVEMKPNSDPVYGKRVAWFSPTDKQQNCVMRQMDFYDKEGQLVKQQFIDWRKIGDAWAWKEVLIKSTLSDAYIEYKMSDIEVNVDLGDSLFSQKTMRRGYRD